MMRRCRRRVAAGRMSGTRWPVPFLHAAAGEPEIRPVLLLFEQLAGGHAVHHVVERGRSAPATRGHLGRRHGYPETSLGTSSISSASLTSVGDTRFNGRASW